MTARNYSNTAVNTTLVGAINDTVTTMVVASTSGFPGSFPYSLILEPGEANEEIVTVESMVGTTLTVIRGEDGTSASSHLSGVTVQHGLTARDAQEPQDHIDASTNIHGLSGGAAVVGTSQAQTLTNKTISGLSNTLTNIPASQVTGTFSSITVSGEGTFADDVAVSGGLTVSGEGTFVDDVGVSGDLIVSGTINGLSNLLGAIDVQVFTTDGTWTKPADAKWVYVECVGAGAGGHWCSSTGGGGISVAPGGGGGGYATEWYDADNLDATESVTVGAGGTRGIPVGNQAPTDGGDSIFATTVAEGGSAPSATMTAGSTYDIDEGGAGGGFTGQSGSNGGFGWPAIRLSGTAVASFGHGGSSGIGSGMAMVDMTAIGSGASGTDGLYPGGGGSGAYNFTGEATGRSGGDGADGVVRVVTFGGA